MRRHNRASKILMAVNYNEEEMLEDNLNAKDLVFEDPFQNCDDDVADPTYLPDKENYYNASITRQSSGSQQTCEYLSCTSEVFAACHKCNSFLCWDHFDNNNMETLCQYHNSSLEQNKRLLEKTLCESSTPTHQHCEFKKCVEVVTSTCTDCQVFLCVSHFDKFMTDKDCSMHESVNRCIEMREDNLDSNLTNQNIISETCDYFVEEADIEFLDSPTPVYQHCEFKNCFEDISTTCIKCKGFLCVSHFEMFIRDENCSMHQSLTTEVPNLQQSKKKRFCMKTAAKKNRNLGLEYINSQKKIVGPRSLKEESCNKTCKFKCSEAINSEARKAIFSNYWAMGDVTRQRDFINQCTTLIKPKYRYPCENCNSERKMRALNNAFYFVVDNKKIRVCKKFFKSTLDINDRVIKTVRDKTNLDGFVTEDLRGKHNNRYKKSEETDTVRKFISAIPRVESHYLRAQTTREFIEGGKTLTQLYDDYKNSCIEQNKGCVSKTLFSKIFHRDFNISFFSPKKDRCEICVSYENSSAAEKAQMQESYDIHHKEKELSRAEKTQDKNSVSPLYVVACYDLQAVLTAPRGEVSVFYYISKLATYNLSVTELVTGSSTCFVWHEGQGQRGVTEIGSCILKYLEKKSQLVDSNDLKMVFYSDNCCGQQKNKYMIALYIYAVNKFKMNSITHKFLIKGHTQNEGDSVHSVIEKQIKRSLKSGPIYCPQEYVSIIKTAKKNPPYYAVEELSFADFYDIKSLCDQIGSNFSKTTENHVVKLSDIKIIQVRKEDPLTFYVKTSYADDCFRRIEIRKKLSIRRALNFTFPETLSKIYLHKIKINEKKKQDILKLIEKRHIPQIYFDFYNTL